MFKRVYPLVLLVVGLVLGGILQPFQASPGIAQAGCQTFKETGKTVCGRFLDYWQKNGGLAQQGLPLSGEFTEVSDLNGKPYTVQYFERAVFEKHPENAAPFDVLLSQLGRFQFSRKYPNGEPSGTSQPTPTTEIIDRSGTTTQKTAPFAMNGGTYEASWRAVLAPNSSSCFFGARLTPVEESFGEAIANTTISREEGSKSASSYLYNVKAGQHYLDVTTTGCTWQIILTRK